MRVAEAEAKFNSGNDFTHHRVKSVDTASPPSRRTFEKDHISWRKKRIGAHDASSLATFYS